MENMENIENIPQEESYEESPVADAAYIMEEPEEIAYEEDIAEAVPCVTKKKCSLKGLKICAAILGIIALVAAGCGITAYYVNSYWDFQMRHMVAYVNYYVADLQQQIEDNSFTGQGNSVSGTPSVTDGLTPGQIHAQNKNSVVGIANQISTNIFGQTTETASSGSGFIISEDGYIVTNYHVIKGATTLTVIMNNEDEYSATVVGYDDRNDFALIKIDAAGLTPVQLGNSDHLIVGDQVCAIGNPLGEITNSLTVGYISVKDRGVTIDNAVINMLQTDTAINPGNSGGPLFNMKGEVVGITTAKFSGQSSSGVSIEGIGFAIPVDDVTGMIEDLKKFGYVTGAYLGVMVLDVDTTAQFYGVPAGAYVEEVTAGGAAERGGLLSKDIITEVGGYSVTSVSDLIRVLRKFTAGDVVSVQVYRNGQIKTLSVTLDEKPHEEVQAETQPQLPQESQQQMPGGDAFQEWYDYFKDYFG